MNGYSFFTIFLCALAILPVLLVFRIVAVEARRRALRPAFLSIRSSKAASEEAPETSSTGGGYAFEQTHRHLRTTAHCEVDRPLKAAVHEFAGAGTSAMYNASGFEYTIKPHHGAMKQEALNLGGFSQVPLLLYDRAGNCFTVHRRLSLN